jgi:hypothetical protein
MNHNENARTTVAVYFFGILGTFMVLAALVWTMYHYTRPPGIDLARAAERRKNLQDVTAQSKEQLETYGWVDKARGIVRLPLDRAMELALRDWQNPVAAKSNLLVRLQKATSPPPNPYE